MPGDAATVGKLAVEMGLDAKQFAQMMEFVEGVTEGAKEELEAYKKSLASTEKQVTSGEKALRGFYREQRLQDRTLREVTQSVSALAFGIAFMTQGNEKAGPTAKKFSDSMLVFANTLNTVEFASFGVAQAAKALPGVLGSVAAGFSKILGPVGLIVAAGAGIATFFAKSNEQARKAAAEGLKEYQERVEAIASGQEKYTADVTKAREEAYRDSIKRLNDQEAILLKLRERMRAYDKERKEAGQERAALVITEAEALATGYTRGMTLTDEYINKLIEGTKGYYDRLQQEIPEGEQIIEGILPALKKATESLNQLETTAIGKRPEAMTPDELKALEKVKSDALKQSIQNRLNMIADSIAQEDQARKAAIDAQYQREVDTANELFLKHKNIKQKEAELAAAAVKRDNAYAQQYIDIANRREMAVYDARIAEAKTIKDAYEREVELAEATYEKEVALAEAEYEKNADNEVRLAALRVALANKRVALDEAVTSKAQRDLQVQEQKYQALTSLVEGLQGAFGQNTDTAFSKLMMLAQLAIRIAAQMAQINAMAAAGASIGAFGPLGIIGMALGGVASIFGGHQAGGYTGPGMGSQPAGPVHAGEYVFEKPLVDRWRPELAAMRASMQRGRGPDVGTMLPQRIEIVGRVDLDNGQLFARREFPGAEKFNKKKTLS